MGRVGLLGVTARFARSAEPAERGIFLNRREKRRFKSRYALRAAEPIGREATRFILFRDD
jgi:hypothetical protein